MSDRSNQPCYVIAEISANHNGSIETALELVRTAKNCGADAVKIQTYTPDTITLDCDNEHFQIRSGTIWDGTTLYKLYQEAQTPWEWHQAIFDEARKVGIDCFSSPFDETAVDFLERFDPPFYKIASFEVIHHPLLKKVAETGRPVILSTGMASLLEIAEAVEILGKNGCPEISLLKCTSAYPAPPEEANLSRILHMAQTFNVRAGLSDHTAGSVVAVAAVALGAKIIEKHFCLSRNEPGPDSAFSMEPCEFAEMVQAIRIAEKAVGRITYDPTEREASEIVYRRSLFVAEDIPLGDPLTDQNIRCIRPGNGMLPKYLPNVLGRRAKRDLAKGTPLDWDSFE
jgi:pseudaminic acid synthase